MVANFRPWTPTLKSKTTVRTPLSPWNRARPRRVRPRTALSEVDACPKFASQMCSPRTATSNTAVTLWNSQSQMFVGVAGLARVTRSLLSGEARRR